MTTSMKKAVFIRLDKIGDLICTLPVDQVSYLQDWEITWVISRGLSFIPEHANPKRNYIELDKYEPKEARLKLEELLREINPDVAISIQAPWWVSYTLWKCKIAKRIGVISKWDSFLFFNTGLRQKRSQAIKHEADYNLDLVKQIDASIVETSAPILKLKAKPQPELLSGFGLTPQKYVVVHPGMAGSALNWPIPNYIQLIDKLSYQYKVVLTGTAADELWLAEIKNQTKTNSQVLCLQNKLGTSQLLYVLEQARAVFAPSTGVIHMAASLGTEVFGFYSPLRVQAPLRWGARGPKVHIFTPKSDGSDPKCMNEITPDQVLSELQ
jgi:heptosyltransferase I